MAIHLLDVMQADDISPEIYSYNGAIFCCDTAGRWQMAAQILENMTQAQVQPNAHTYRTMIFVYAKTGHWLTSIKLLHTMLEEGFEADHLCYHILFVHVENADICYSATVKEYKLSYHTGYIL